MARRKQRSRCKALIPKSWSDDKDIRTLPNGVREKVVEAISRIRMGEPPDPDFFKTQYRRGPMRSLIAYELQKAGLSYGDIAILLDLTLAGTIRLLDRTREQQMSGLGPNWALAMFKDQIDDILLDAAWNRAQSETTADEQLAARSRQQATAASKAVADLIIRGQESKMIMDALREAANRNKETDDSPPDPVNREDLLEWVFWNKVVKRLQPSENAEIEAESQPKTDRE